MATQHCASLVFWSLVRSVVSIIRTKPLTLHSGRIFPGLLDQLSFRHAIILDKILILFGTHGLSDYDTANGQSWLTVPLGA